MQFPLTFRAILVSSSSAEIAPRACLSSQPIVDLTLATFSLQPLIVSAHTNE